jgi:peroxin-6
MARLQDLLKSCLPDGPTSSALQLSILVKGPRGAGKKSLIHSMADEVGLNVVPVSGSRP